MLFNAVPRTCILLNIYTFTCYMYNFIFFTSYPVFFSATCCDLSLMSIVQVAFIFLCLSQARINWEVCGRKGIPHKNGGNDGDRLLISPDGVAPTQIIGMSASCY